MEVASHVAEHFGYTKMFANPCAAPPPVSERKPFSKGFSDTIGCCWTMSESRAARADVPQAFLTARATTARILSKDWYQGACIMGSDLAITEFQQATRKNLADLCEFSTVQFMYRGP